MRSQFPSALRLGALMAAFAGRAISFNDSYDFGIMPPGVPVRSPHNTFTAYRPQSAESQQFYHDRAVEKRIRKARILEARADAGVIRRHVLKGEIIPPEPTKVRKPRAKKVAV